MILIVGCSQTKAKDLTRGPARLIYTGRLTQLGLEYAETFGLKAYILSAKYGIITPDEVIDTYDLKAKKAFNHLWPLDPGYWVGSKVYFKNTPPWIKRLLPEGYNQSYGQQKGLLMDSIRTKNALR